MNNFVVKERICQGFSTWTGQPCGAKAVGENTLKKGTREFLDPRFCQMHQPGRLSKKKCVCPHCTHCRSLDRSRQQQQQQNEGVLEESVMEEESQENLFGRKKNQKKKKTYTRKRKVK